jgi:hypothetical protein
MNRFFTSLLALIIISWFTNILAQDIVRKQLDVPKVDPALITIDAEMNESVWQNAAQVNLITSTGYEIFANKYYRENLVEPEYDELICKIALGERHTLCFYSYR